MVTFAAPGLSANEPKRILLLHSFGRDLTPLDIVAMNFPPEFDQRWGGPTTFYNVTLQPASFGQTPNEKPLVDYLDSMFKNHQLGLVVSVGGPAAQFAHKYRQQLFSSIPIVLAAVDYRHVQDFLLDANETMVPVVNQATDIVENIRQILPETRTIYMVSGNSNLERFWKDEMTDEFRRFEDELAFEWLNDLSYADLLTRCASLPAHSAIFFIGFTVDANGVSLTEAHVLSELRSSANAPIFGQHSTQLGRGVVGGPVMAIDIATQNAATVAVRVLRGESPANIRVPPQQPGPPVYDWRELSRWNIDERRLPAGSTVRFQEPTAWQQYKWQIVAGISILTLQGILIVALLVNHIKRRHAERNLRESRNRLGSVLEAAAEGIVTVNDRGLIESVNPAAEKIFGYGEAEMVGQNADLLTSSPYAFVPTAVNASCELEGRRKGGTVFPIEVAVSEVILDQHRVRTAFVRDITERKLVERTAREFAGRLLQAQEAERSRLARELHDDVTQRLAQLAIELGQASAKPEEPAAQNEAIRSAREKVRNLSADVHSLAYNLHPAFLDRLDLSLALKTECERFSRQESISIAVKLGPVPAISPEVKLCLFRVVQEALNNVRRHAQALSAEVFLGQSDNGLQVSVSDTGVGFDLNRVTQRPSLGLASMEERVRLLGGKLDIQSFPGQGTTILVWVPLHQIKPRLPATRDSNGDFSFLENRKNEKTARSAG